MTIDLGRTMPEKTSFMASSTEMLVSTTSSSMMKAMFLDVGLGTVGIYTATMDFSLSSEYTCPVTNPIATIPSRGHSTKTTRLKLNCPENDVIACWVTPNTVPTTGMLPRTTSFTRISIRPGGVVMVIPTR